MQDISRDLSIILMLHKETRKNTETCSISMLAHFNVDMINNICMVTPDSLDVHKNVCSSKIEPQKLLYSY